MKYLLDLEEYEALMEAGDRAARRVQADLQQVCSLAADHVPVTDGTWWVNKPWGCILTTDQECCDACPVQHECPNPDKEWSK